MSAHRGTESSDLGGPTVSKPIYEIPVTDPAAPPFGAPGAAGAMPPRHGQAPPQTSGSAPVDYSQLPPPAVASVDAGAPAPTPSAAPAAPGIPGFTPAPAMPMPGLTPPPSEAYRAAPAPTVAPVAAPAAAATAVPGYTPPPAAPFPGFTPAPTAESMPGLVMPEVLPVPVFAELPSLEVEPEPEQTGFVDDEYTQAARAKADGELLEAMAAVVDLGASDLHISAGSPPLVRIDGALRPVPGLPVWDRERVAAALYSLMTDEQAAQFDEVLELDFAFTLSENSRFRVNYYLQRGAIGGALRLIPTKIKTLESLGVPDTVSNFSKLARGLVLVTGPTGSGKSTTLAALVDLVNSTRSDHIMTVEDPIEFMHQNKRALINQREVGHDTQSFGAALKHVLRQDPDVILIGELRDLETISVALTAAETGHLVFATLHTQDAGQTIDRVIDVFPPHQQGQVRAQLAATLQGVVCQTLVPRASGSGRAVATEVMVANPAIANLIREGKTYQVRSALQAGRAQGMHTMDQHLAELVNQGVVTHGAALEKVHDPEDFKRLVHRSAEPARI
jgi:twitching motility protein PilT